MSEYKKGDRIQRINKPEFKGTIKKSYYNMYIVNWDKLWFKWYLIHKNQIEKIK